MVTQQQGGPSETPRPAILRPFACEECSSLYTRQEHLDRHITAKHRVSKAFVCSFCQKGFARRDILRRHEHGHMKAENGGADVPKPPAASRAKKDTKKRALDPDDDGKGEAPAKATRIARACNRCSKSKLRCDGEEPCARCARAGIACAFDRAGKQPSAVASTSQEASNSSASHSDAAVSEAAGESGEDDMYAATEQRRFSGGTNALHEMAMGADSWNRPSPPVGMSPYSVPIRQQQQQQQQQHQQQQQQHLQHALPPSSFHQPPPSHAPYLPRHLEPFGYQRQQQYPGPSVLPSYPGTNQHSPSNPSILPYTAHSPAANGSYVATSSPWDQPAFGRSIIDSPLGTADFLELIASGSIEQEIDWDLLNSGYAREGFTPQGGTGYTPREGNSPGTMDLETSLLGPNALHHLERNQLDSHPSLLVDPAQSSSHLFPSSSLNAIPSQSSTGLTVADSAAESLLQLASRTPHDSPEPEPLPPSEPAVRSSHPSHTPSDPWPLSYRPSIGYEDVLPAGMSSRSRCPSPTSRDLSSIRHTALVPRVTESTRETILEHVREISKDFDPFRHSERFVPQLELLDLFVQLFFERFHSLLPLIHLPTFDPNECPSFLVLTVASIGARYAHDRVKGATMYAQALSETARRMCQIMGDSDNRVLRTVAWQQSLLFVLLCGLFSGNKRDLERTQAFAEMPITFCRRQGWLKEPVVDERVEGTFSLEERWKRWRDREEIKRLGFGAIIFDGVGTAVWDLESSSLFVDAAQTSLPCGDQYWEAPTATAWQALFRGSILPARGLETLAAINQVTDRSLHCTDSLLSISRDVFALSSVITILHVIGVRKLQETHLTGLFLPAASQFEKPFSPVQAALDAGLEFFQDRVVLPPEIQSMLPESSVTASSMALMLHLTSMTLRLPLRLLQSLARTGDSRPAPEILDAVRAWSVEDHGQVSRATAWHAGQLFGLVRIGSHPHDTPIEPMALFYAAITLFSYHQNSSRCTNRLDSIALDRLVDRADPQLASWLATGEAVPSLAVVGELDDPRAGEKLLRICGEKLVGLEVWRVGELLGKTLLQLAEEETKRVR